MRKELNSIAEYKKLSSDAFASIARSFGEANNRFKALAVKSVGRAVRFSLSSSPKPMTPTFPRYRGSEGCSSSGTVPSLLGHKNCHLPISTKKRRRPQAQLAEAEVNAEPAGRRTAAQSMPTKRKTGTAAKSQSGSKRSAKGKRKVGPVRRGKS